MESEEVRTRSPVSADVRLRMSHSTRTAGGNTADPPGASSEHENSPTEKQNKRQKKKGIRAFFRRIGKSIRHIFGRDEDAMVSPFPCSDPTDVQTDLSVDPCPSGMELPVNADPEPSPVPGPSALDSEIPGPALEKQKKRKKGICAFLRRFRKSNKVSPDWFADEPEPLSVSSPSALDSGIEFSVLGSSSGEVAPVSVDLADPEPKPIPGALDVEPVPGPSGLVPVAKQDPADSQSGSVSLDPQLTLDSGPSGLVSEFSVLGSSSGEVAPVSMGLADPEPKPVPRALHVKPVPRPSGFGPATGSVSSFYEIKGQLGKGAFGTVCEGTRRSDGQKVAVKFQPKNCWNRFIELPGSTKRMLSEVAVNLLMRKPPTSPHVVQMLDWFDQPDQFVLIMEYPHPCENLFSFILRNRGPLDETVARGLMRQALRAAKHMVDRGVYHRDIHTGNILVNTETLQIKFIDFGCSQLFKTSEDRELVVESSVWSLGKVLLEMMRGFKELSVPPAEKLIALLQHLSNECQDLIRKCLDLDPTRLTLEQMLEHPWFEQD